ncbi:MAG: hypothetical protein ACI81R_000905 [Bradymonadia bacterium]|jgi:hypothetical protein
MPSPPVKPSAVHDFAESPCANARMLANASAASIQRSEERRNQRGWFSDR